MQSAAQVSTAAPAEPSPSTDLLKRAIAMAFELEQLLRHDDVTESREGFRLRLARAHSLSVVDALTELVCRNSAPAPVPVFQSGVYAVSNQLRD